jgi:formylglycine-generating enzyme required for sulfatase activity
MQSLEILALTTMLLALLSLILPRSWRSRWTIYLPGAAVVLILIHLLLEGPRWQMVPAYVLAAVLFLATVRRILPGAELARDPVSCRRRGLTIAGMVLGLLVLALAVALPSLWPVRRLREPTEPGVGDTRVRAADGMAMVYVPAGEFRMGTGGLEWIRRPESSRDRERVGPFGAYGFPDERPQHRVYLDAFWMDRTEVTVSMFRTFVQDTGYETTAERQGWGKPWTAGPMESEWPHVAGADWQHPRGPESQAEDDHPVAQVSWEDAAAYCEWAGGSLPTEAQWAKACRGTDGRMWPWGDTFEANRASSCEAQCPIERWKDDRFDDGYAFTSPAGSFPDGASPYGALDMAGNLWEWVADWYGEETYGHSPYENPTGPESGTVRAMRGGSWYDTGVWKTCTVRHQNPAWDLYDDVGFRCAMSAQP